MLGLAWLTLRQAQEALENGRLDEAHRLLGQPEVQGHKGASPLIRQVAQGFVNRGDQRLRHDDVAAAWNDLLQAEKLGCTDNETSRLRQALTQRALAEVHKLLEAAEPGRALEAIGRLDARSAKQAEVQILEEVAKGWNLARDLAARGEFALAQEMADRIRQLLPKPMASLERFRGEVDARRQQFAAVLVQLHEAVGQERWRDVVPLSEQVLALAPQHAEARKARARAWKVIEPAPAVGPRHVDEPAPAQQRFLLWVDGAGGYLVCLGSRVTLGQAAPDGFADVPLLADVSRNHAALTRDAEGYVLEAVRAVQVNGQSAEKTLLQPGDRITLGSSCQIQFRQPVPVSATARLDMVSGHRLPLRVDGVILMADTLVMGPGSQAHVTVPDLARPVVLFRYKDGLGVRHAGNFQVDGQPCKDRGNLGLSGRVEGEDFALAVEPVGPGMGRS
jgi:hypothetical protein